MGALRIVPRARVDRVRPLTHSRLPSSRLPVSRLPVSHLTPRLDPRIVPLRTRRPVRACVRAPAALAAFAAAAGTATVRCAAGRHWAGRSGLLQTPTVASFGARALGGSGKRERVSGNG
jgi:hypothetical protein